MEVTSETVCAGCDAKISGEYVCIAALNKVFHKDCLTCTNCKTTLIGVSIVPKEGKLYCRDCHIDLFAMRCLSLRVSALTFFCRCAHCSAAITGQYEQALGKVYCKGHLKCCYCETSLGKTQFCKVGKRQGVI